MPNKQTLKEVLSPQVAFLVGLAITLVLSLVGLTHQTHAESSMDTYTDNAGGQQQMRIVKASGKNRPAIVYVHGGGWAVDGGTFNPAAQNEAAKQGYTSFRIKYRLMPGGVYEQLQDVLRAIQHVKKNASKYGINPNKIAIMGDSAGGSLTVRAAATGKSGAAAAVGLSAPTNAFRDLFNSWRGFADGMFHSRCIGEYFPPFTMDVINFFNGESGDTLRKLGSGQALSAAESSALLTQSLKLADIVITDLPSTVDKLDKAANDFGVSAKATDGNGNEVSIGSNTSTGTDKPSQSDVKAKLSNLNTSDLEKIGTAIYQFNRTAQNIQNNQATSDDVLQTLSVIKQGIDDIVGAQNSISQEKANAGKNTQQLSDLQPDQPLVTKDPSSTTATSTSSASVSINPQQISASKIAQCIDDFIQMSPALFASPRTPPTLLVNYTTDELVNPQDAYQMRDKLRSMGIRSEVFMKKGQGPLSHLGYEPWVEKPVYKFLKSVLRP